MPYLHRQMEKRLIIYTGILALLLILMTTAGCNRRSAVDEKMDLAASLMTSKPDSALAVLESIPASDVNGKETSARYALLKSMALDKNYMDTTTFDVLQPAIDYYIEHGTPDEQLRTYYYQGRIYQNKGDDDMAMQSFMLGKECCKGVSDTLTMANLMVAQATIQYRIYKIDDFIENNLEAAKLYSAIGRADYELLSLVNALDGGILNNDKSLSDSVWSIAKQRVSENPDLHSIIVPYELSYALKFGNKEDVINILEHCESVDSINDVVKLNVAGAYYKIGDVRNAKRVLDAIPIQSKFRSSLKYLALTPDILEQNGDIVGALQAYKDFYTTIDSIHQNIFSHDLLFADKKHQLEIDNLMEIRDRDRIIFYSLCGLLAMALLAGWLYYRGHVRSLETTNLKWRIRQLENERDNLKGLQEKQSELAKPVQDVIKMRLDMLNSLLAKEITNNNAYSLPYDKWIESIHKDKDEFMNTTRLAFKASHPKFIEYLEQHGLDEAEINYVCLYAIGLRGKEVGEYIQLKHHYHISSDVRKKLNMTEHDTNLGIYIRHLMKGL